MSFSSFSRQFRQQWSDHALIVGMSEHGENGTARLSARGNGCDRSDCRKNWEADTSTH
jgi:hypothetical protein